MIVLSEAVKSKLLKKAWLDAFVRYTYVLTFIINKNRV